MRKGDLVENPFSVEGWHVVDANVPILAERGRCADRVREGGGLNRASKRGCSEFCVRSVQRRELGCTQKKNPRGLESSPP